MSGPRRVGGRGALTPAVLAAAAFTTLAALVAVAFVTARGGLELPLAATASQGAAIASAEPTPEPSWPSSPTGAPTSVAPSAAAPTAAPSAPPSVGPPSPSPEDGGASDPLLALPGCPDHPGCYLYVVHRGDSYTALSDRYVGFLWIMDALNPEVSDKRVIVVGQTLYLGHDPTARLDLCPGGACHLYVVRAGDSLTAIASRYGLSLSAIEALNPGLRPAQIVPGQTIRLPLYQPA